jgi:uncharacterized MAPEG superfamily protein
VPALTGVAGRLERALRNFAETLALFAVDVLAALDRANSLRAVIYRVAPNCVVSLG